MKRRGAVTRGEEREALQRVALRQPPEMFLVKPTFGWLVGLSERKVRKSVGQTGSVSHAGFAYQKLFKD